MGRLIRDPFGEPVLMRKAYGEALVELGDGGFVLGAVGLDDDGHE